MTAIESAYRDIGNAFEEDRFALETPRVYPDEKQLSGFKICVSENNGAYTSGVGCVGPRTLDLSFDFREGTERPFLYEEFRDHVEDDDPIVLYGDSVMWYVSDVWDYQVSGWNNIGGEGGIEGDARFAWETVEIAGPR